MRGPQHWREIIRNLRGNSDQQDARNDESIECGCSDNNRARGRELLVRLLPLLRRTRAAGALLGDLVRCVNFCKVLRHRIIKLLAVQLPCAIPRGSFAWKGAKWKP